MIENMRELKDTLERAAWLATRKPIGFIGGEDNAVLQRDIWTVNNPHLRG